jgi:hypothetical protein
MVQDKKTGGVFSLTCGTSGNIQFSGRVNLSKKMVDDLNLTAFIIRYRCVRTQILPNLGTLQQRYHRYGHD